MKHNEATSRNRQIQQKWHLPNEMPRLPTKIYRTNRRLQKIMYIFLSTQRTCSKENSHITNIYTGIYNVIWFMIDYACVIHVYRIIGSSYEQDQKIAALDSSEMYLVSVCVAVSTFTKRSTHCAYSVM
jgi:ACR3 family arsenite efflux pump ArsB